MQVCISSPVRSKKPVLIKATRDLAAAMHAAKLTLVRRSSSMMPSFTVEGFKPNTFSTRPNKVSAKPTSLGPCILGFTM